MRLAGRVAELGSLGVMTHPPHHESATFRGTVLPLATGMFVVVVAFWFALVALKYGLPLNRGYVIRRLAVYLLLTLGFAWLISTVFTVSISPKGVQAYSFWGPVRFVRWSDIASARVCWLLTLKYVRLRSRSDGRVTWLLLSLKDADRFRELVHQYAAPDCPILRHTK